ncbi:MAG TPA: kinase [Pseudomonadaceae bacterium]|nr:kinase [Pseudomonadaceae bacterium]
MSTHANLQHALDQFVARESLPADYKETVERWFLPLAEEILQLVARSHRAPIIGVSGCQGSGKTTLASLLVLLAGELAGLRAVSLSIDDFYHSRETRQQLAQDVHPLFATRGVPGTHDVELALRTLDSLRSEGEVAIPRFDKAVDDRLPEADWPRLLAPVDLIVLEGWCLSVPPQAPEQLHAAINELEAQEDPQGSWRSHVNTVLDERYRDWYDMVDYLVMLKAPGFGKVREWRGRQERKLAERAGAQATKLMSEQELDRFIQHYERITRHGLEVLPQLADVVFELTEAQSIAGRSRKSSEASAS